VGSAAVPRTSEVDPVEAAGRIKDFIKEEILFEDTTAELNDDTQLLNGVMDSLGLMQLVAFLEEEFDVEIDDADMTADHFRTVGDIEQLVNQKVGQKAG
jgi:acyl carrier protein